MTKTTTPTQNSLHISEAVVRSIVKEAIKEVDGVFGLANLPNAPKSKSIAVSLATDAIQVDIGIVLFTGGKLKDICEQIQRTVKDSVQAMAGVTVSKVNVFVTGVCTEAKQ